MPWQANRVTIVSRLSLMQDAHVIKILLLKPWTAWINSYLVGTEQFKKKNKIDKCVPDIDRGTSVERHIFAQVNATSKKNVLIRKYSDILAPLTTARLQEFQCTYTIMRGNMPLIKTLTNKKQLYLCSMLWHNYAIARNMVKLYAQWYTILPR